MSDAVLTAETRDQRGSRPVSRLRLDGLVPAVVYGLGGDNISVTVPAKELDGILHSESGVNTVITLQIGGDGQMTLARQIQRDPVRGNLLHVDFVRVDPNITVSAEVPVHLENEPAGVKSGGVLEQLIFTLSVEAKPADIPNAVTGDVAALEIGDQLRVAEISLPPGVTTTQEQDELVAQVIAPRVEEEPVVAEGEEGEGEGEEGEAPAEGAEEASAEGAPAESSESSEGE